MSIVGYIRVSDEDQVASGLGAAAQRAAIEKFAKEKGRTARAIDSDDGLSGHKKAQLHKRPGLISAIGRLKKGDWLVVAKRDRFARDLIEAAIIERAINKKGCQLLSVAGEGTGGDPNDPLSMFVPRLMDLLAEYESLLIGSRVRAAMAQKRARGEFCGGPAPYGFSAVPTGEVKRRKVVKDGRSVEEDYQVLKLVPDKKEMAVVKICKAGLVARYTERRIVNALAEDGFLDRAGRPFSKAQVHRILVRLKKTQSE